MTWLYRPRPGYTIDLKQCRASVSEGAGFSFHQCTRKGIIEREGIKYCRQHDPVVQAAKDEARRAEWKAAAEEREMQFQKEKAWQKLSHAAVDAIRLIAAGHNDPRALAQSVLKGRKL